MVCCYCGPEGIEAAINWLWHLIVMPDCLPHLRALFGLACGVTASVLSTLFGLMVNVTVS